MTDATRRVVGLVAVALVVAVGCFFAGLWQWQRADDRERAIQDVRTNFAADPVPLDELVASPAASIDESETWRPATVTGRYVPDATVLLRNRPVDGKPSFHLLTPLVIDDAGSALDGSVLVVDRGWVPIGGDATGEVDVPEPPSGPVTAEVRVRPAERESTREAPPGQAHSIFPAQVVAAARGAADVPGEVVSEVYGALVTESPAPAVSPGTLPQPSTDYGPHRSYAMQWWMFSVGALVGFGILAWRERRVEDADDGASDAADVPLPDRAAQGQQAPTAASTAARPEPRRRRRPTAEEEEDALIDAQASETRSR